MTILTKKDLIEAIMNINRNKNELIKDLCSRLPYGVKVQMSDGAIEELINVNVSTFICNGLKGLPKPYLFPLSSMTEKQSKEYHELIGGMFGTSALINFEVLTDFFNSNHLDYRGLIEKSLALDATNLGIYE